MPTEYLYLTIMTLFFILAWLPASLGKKLSYGTKWMLSNRNPQAERELLPWAARCERAHNNLKDNFPAFAVAIILLGLTQKFDEGTSIATTIFVVARIGHFISYAMGNVTARGLFFLLGLGANLYLLAKLFL